MALTKTEVSELYVILFNRASEKSGNQNWLNSGYNTVATMADAMLDTDAADEYYASLNIGSNEDFVEYIYDKALNKPAPVDADGKAEWVKFLEAGNSKGEMVAKMIEAIKEYQEGGSKYDDADQATKDAAKQFANRVEVSDYTADNLENIDVSEIDSTVSFDVLNVTHDTTTIDAAKDKVDALKKPADGDTGDGDTGDGDTGDGETFTLTTGLADLEAAHSALDTFIEAIDLDEDGTADYASITALNNAVKTAESNVAGKVGTDYTGGSAAIKAQLVSAAQTALNNTLALDEIKLTEAQANVAAVTGLSAAITALENATEVAADALTSQTAATKAYNIALATAEAAADIELSSAGSIAVDTTAGTGTVKYGTAVYAEINDAGKFDVVAFADATTTLTETQYNAMIDILNPLINAYSVKVDADATKTNADAEKAYAQAVVDHLDISKAAATKLAEVGNGFTLTTPANKNLPTYDEVQDEITALIIDAASKYDTFDGALNDLYDGTNGAIDTYNSTVYTGGLTAVGPTLGTSNAIITKITANDGADDFDVIVVNATTGLLEVDTDVVTDETEQALLADIVTTANAYNSTLTAAVEALQASYDFADTATAAATTGEPADLTTAIATLVTQDSLVDNTVDGLYDLFVTADGGVNTLTTALTNAQNAIYNDNNTPDDTTDDSGSQYNINVLEELLAEEQTLINLAADAQVLVDAITIAEEAFVDAGYGEPVYLDIAKTYYATSGDDLYVVDTEVASIVRSFSTQGEDVLYIGTSHTVNTATLAATTDEAKGLYSLKDAGDQSVLEVFMEQVGTDLKLYFESETYSSETTTGKTPGADMTTVTLVGVSLEDITITDGMLTIA